MRVFLFLLLFPITALSSGEPGPGDRTVDRTKEKLRDFLSQENYQGKFGKKGSKFQSMRDLNALLEMAQGQLGGVCGAIPADSPFRDEVLKCVVDKNKAYVQSNIEALKEEISELSTKIGEVNKATASAPLDYKDWYINQLQDRLNDKRASLKVYEMTAHELNCFGPDKDWSQMPIFENSEQVYYFINKKLNDEINRNSSHEKMYKKVRRSSPQLDLLYRANTLNSQSSNAQEQPEGKGKGRKWKPQQEKDLDELVSFLKDAHKSGVTKVAGLLIDAFRGIPGDSTPPGYSLLINRPRLVDIATKNSEALRRRFLKNPGLMTLFNEQITVAENLVRSAEVDGNSEILPNAKLSSALLFELKETVKASTHKEFATQQYYQNLYDGLLQNHQAIEEAQTAFTKIYREDCLPPEERATLTEKTKLQEKLQNAQLHFYYRSPQDLKTPLKISLEAQMMRAVFNARSREDISFENTGLNSGRETLDTLPEIEYPPGVLEHLEDQGRWVKQRYAAVQEQYSRTASSSTTSFLDELPDLNEISKQKFSSEHALFHKPGETELSYLYANGSHSQFDSNACVGHAINSQAEKASISESGSIIPPVTLSPERTYGIIKAYRYTSDFKNPGLNKRVLSNLRSDRELGLTPRQVAGLHPNRVKQMSDSQVARNLTKILDDGVFMTSASMTNIGLTLARVPLQKDPLIAPGTRLDIPNQINSSLPSTFVTKDISHKNFGQAVVGGTPPPNVELLIQAVEKGHSFGASTAVSTRRYHEDWMKFEPGNSVPHMLEVVGADRNRRDPYDGKIKPAFLVRDSMCTNNCPDRYISAEELSTLLIGITKLEGVVRKPGKDETSR